MNPKGSSLAQAVAAHEAQVEAERAANGGKLKKHPHQELVCISYWYGRLLQTPVRMPQTIIIRPDVDLYEFCAILETNCPKETADKFDSLVAAVTHACGRLRYPAFLRTGTFSGKHDWKFTCYIESPETDIRRHLCELIEGAAVRDQCLDVFAVREFLPTEPAFRAFRGDMPIVKERRYFARDGVVLGHIPYWPEDAFEDQPVSIDGWREAVAELATLSKQDEGELDRRTAIAAHVLPGEWSIDWLWTKNGWYLTDCAPARMSYGWDLLPAAARGDA